MCFFNFIFLPFDDIIKASTEKGGKKMKTVFKPYTTKEIKPTGWLRDQLVIQANGLSGNLDKMWPDVRDSKWIGGDKDGWERVPYWLDGFIPLAYLLDDEDMKARAKKYIDAILAGQQEDGWICPCDESERSHYDMWALFLITKVLVLYHDCTGDERIEEAVYRALKQFHEFTQHRNTVFLWAHARWYECVIAIAWLYERRPEEWILELAHLLEVQGTDFFKLGEYVKKEASHWSLFNHVVNLAMCLKSDAVMSMLDGRDPEKRAERFLKTLCRYHGNVNGYFNGDECLATSAPNRGTELCGIVEAMYSYETISLTTKNTVWMDRCERLAFNALPATVSEDMWTHQYDQMSNQPYCVPYESGKKHFGTNGRHSHIFGLEPNYGCCTANFNQGFPKFALSCFMKAEDGIAVASLAPCSVTDTVDGNTVTLETKTLYPFRDTVNISVKCQKPSRFKLYIRIPAFFDSATVNGQEVSVGEYFTMDREFYEDEIEIKLHATPKFVKRGSLNAVVRGALTYTLPVKERWERVEYEKNGVVRQFPYCDYHIYAESPWQYGFSDTYLEYVEKDGYVSAFCGMAPLSVVKVKVKPIDWGFKEEVEYIAATTPRSRKPAGDEVTVELVPYGVAKLRMTELPFVNK